MKRGNLILSFSDMSYTREDALTFSPSSVVAVKETCGRRVDAIRLKSARIAYSIPDVSYLTKIGGRSPLTRLNFGDMMFKCYFYLTELNDALNAIFNYFLTIYY